MMRLLYHFKNYIATLFTNPKILDIANKNKFNIDDKVTLASDIKRDIFTIIENKGLSPNSALQKSFNYLVKDRNGGLWTFRDDSLELCTSSESLYDKSMDLYQNWKINNRQQKLNLIFGHADKDLDRWLEEYNVREEYCLIKNERRIIIKVPIGKLK